MNAPASRACVAAANASTRPAVSVASVRPATNWLPTNVLAKVFVFFQL